MATFATSDSTSQSLVRGLQNRCPVAWSRIATIYSPLILHWTAQMQVPAADREDVCQEVLTAVIQYGARFRQLKPTSSFRSWLWTITHRCVQHIRRDPHRLTTLDAQQLADFVNSPLEDEPEHSPEIANRMLFAAKTIVQNSVNPRTWDIFQDAIAEELSFEAIADRYETTTANVRQIKFRLTARIRDLLELTDDAS
ncbi:RNA polymerase sigma factor SigX [Rubripirellula tenax]|uniref:RNA polymerase sigma factor SigX n=1 Tax=Rubripirellula tenax TaxID=2528015 RepID=A0A5C6F6G1_9BACT|nr:sigma-70 family RNA polymerase sigma factor [Rubripirellula tenax]TWU56835.1 RNA polymerase sigma factor SigX [Rubripirellula tenax]